MVVEEDQRLAVGGYLHRPGDNALAGQLTGTRTGQTGPGESRPDPVAQRTQLVGRPLQLLDIGEPVVPRPQPGPQHDLPRPATARHATARHAATRHLAA